MWSRRVKQARWRLRHHLRVIKKRIGAATTKAWALWAGISSRYQHFFVNLLIGLAIECVLLAAHDTPPIVAARNWAIDTSIRAVAAIRGAPTSARAITVFDIDDETWRSDRWGGEPERAPRPQLGQLLRFAQAGNPDAIVLDVITDYPGAKGDEKLAGELAALARQPGGPPILLVRTLREPLPQDGGSLPQLRRSPLDAVIDAAPTRLFRAAPYFRVSADGVVREWQLWRAACMAPDGADARSSGLLVLPSVQLALAALRRPSAAPVPVATTTACDAGREDGALNSATDTMTRWLDHRRDIGLHRVEAGEHVGGSIDLASRILYREPNPPVSGRVQIVSALKILEQAHQVPRDFRGQIVIIGQSNEGARDVHDTPLGKMPGTLLLANAAMSLESVGLIEEMPIWFDILFKILMIACAAAVFARWRSLSALLIIFLPFTTVIGVASYDMLHAGYWLDFAVPLIGLYAHRLIAAFEEEFLQERPGSHCDARPSEETST